MTSSRMSSELVFISWRDRLAFSEDGMRLKRRKEMPLLRAEPCRSAMDSDPPAGVQTTCSPAENRKKEKGMSFNSCTSLFHPLGLTWVVRLDSLPEESSLRVS